MGMGMGMGTGTGGRRRAGHSAAGVALSRGTSPRRGGKVRSQVGWCLTRRRGEARRRRIGVTDGPVLGDALGGYRDRNNVGGAFRRARAGTDYEWGTPHPFRKAVATILDGQGASARMIADQLGHSRISRTRDVFLGRRAVVPELAGALESLDEDQRPRTRETGPNERMCPARCPVTLLWSTEVTGSGR